MKTTVIAKQAINTAMEMVSALCQPKGTEGARNWTMSIPARRDYDPDLVIANGLRLAKEEIERLENHRDELQKSVDFLDGQVGKLASSLKEVTNCLRNWVEIADEEDTRVYDTDAIQRAEALLAGTEFQPDRRSGLRVEISSGQLTISIGIDTLCHAVSIGRSYGMGDLSINNADVFAAEMLNELNAESEDGSTMVHNMLDTAASQAIDNGAEGAEYDDKGYE